MSWDCTCAVGWVNGTLSPVVYGDIALSIKNKYTKIHTKWFSVKSFDSLVNK